MRRHSFTSVLAATLVATACVPDPTNSTAGQKPKGVNPEARAVGSAHVAPEPHPAPSVAVEKPVQQSPAQHFPKEFQLTSMRGTPHHPYIDGNTLHAVRAARAEGIGYIEIDLVLTSDGALVTAHQPYVEGCGTVSKLTLSQVQGCRVKGSLQLADLEQILELSFKGFFLDLKDTKERDAERAQAAVERAAEVVLSAKKRDESVLMMYDTPASAVHLVKERKLRAGIKGYPKSEDDTREMVKRAARTGFEMVSVNVDYVSPQLIEESAAQGVWHLPWSTDPARADHWRALAEAGAGGLIVLHFELAEKTVLPYWVDVRSTTGRML